MDARTDTAHTHTRTQHTRNLFFVVAHLSVPLWLFFVPLSGTGHGFFHRDVKPENILCSEDRAHASAVVARTFAGGASLQTLRLKYVKYIQDTAAVRLDSINDRCVWVVTPGTPTLAPRARSARGRRTPST